MKNGAKTKVLHFGQCIRDMLIVSSFNVCICVSAR